MLRSRSANASLDAPFHYVAKNWHAFALRAAMLDAPQKEQDKIWQLCYTPFTMNQFMKLAINEAELGIAQGHGGPFGAVVVKNGKVIGTGHNQVVRDLDPTWHGEIEAIQAACKNLNTFDLEDADLYTTAEPCPMCLSACLWANINKIYYGCSLSDNESIGFRDEVFYKYLSISKDRLQGRMIQIDREPCLKLFAKYNKIKDRVMY